MSEHSGSVKGGPAPAGPPRALRAIAATSSLVGVWSGLAIMVFIATIIPDLLSRALLRVAIPMADDISVTTLVAVAFLGMAVAQAKGEHFDMRVLDHVLRPRALAALRIVRLALSLAIVVVTAVLCIGATVESISRAEVTMSIIAFPVWPARSMVALGLVLLALQIAGDLYLALRALRRAA